MGDVLTLQELQIDALREVASIGAGHAATALSQMTDSRIMITVPRLTLCMREDAALRIGGPDQPLAAVRIHMLGDLTGRTLLVFPRAAALRLAELMLRRPRSMVPAFGELEQSAIKETGNILSGAYMNALSEFTGLLLIPSPPSLGVGTAAAVLTSAGLQLGTERDPMLVLETEFSLDDIGERLRGFFLLLPDPASLKALLRAIHLV